MKLIDSIKAVLWQKKGAFLGIWLIGGALTLLLYFATEQNYKNKLEQKTEVLIEQAVELVQKRFEIYEYGLLSTRGAIIVAGKDAISRQSFARYIGSMDLAREFPGARGFGFIRRVAADQEHDFILQARADGAPDFSIRTLTLHHKDRFVIQYIYPQLNNKDAIGLDIGSEAQRRAAATRAAITGKPTLSAPITLVQEKGKTRRGFLILLPIYSTELSNDLAENRLKATIGWSYAPLIVDDVLFDLGLELSEIDLTITDKVEQTPFFDTAKGDNKQDQQLTAISVSREIEFMGRKWGVRANPNPNMSAKFAMYSSVWIVSLGLITTSLLSFVLLLWTMKHSENPSLTDKQNSVTLASFFASPVFSMLWKGYLLIMLCIIGPSGYLYLEQEVNAASLLLIDHARYSEGLIKKQQQSHREGLSFIKSTPAIAGIMQKQRSGNDSPVINAAWEERLAETFKAYMLPLIDVYQISLIKADQTGTELLRVDRKGNSLMIAPEGDLQQKGDRPYFINTLKLNNNDIYTSGIEPNLENGVMEVPLRLSQHYATPIFYPDGSPFAIIVINVEAQSLLNEISALSQEGEFIYIINARSEFILSDDQTKVYDSFSNQGYVWDNAFMHSSNILGLLPNNISIWQGDKGAVISAQAVVSPNYGESTGQLIIRATQRTYHIYKNALSLLTKQIFILLSLSILGLVLFYFSWANSKRKNSSIRIKKELEEQKQKDKMFESLTELSPEAMVICDTEGTIVLVNSQAEKLFGYCRVEMLGNKIHILVPAAIASKHEKYVKNYIHKPTIRPMGAARELYGRYADGSEFPVEVSLSPVQLDDQLLIASSVRNVSQRKYIENSLKEAINEAKSASQAKSAFLANMSHEIRTPLNAVIGLTHLLKDAGLSAAQLSLVSKIQLAGRSLLGIVNDILDLAKIEANEITIRQAPCNIKEMLDELYSVFSSQAESKNLELHLTLDPKLSFWVNTDRKLLQQVITNLLSNAIKFTNQGTVYLSASCIDSETLPASQQLVCFAIEDTGIGIAKETQERIFQPFNQADHGTNRRFDGTGLGLSIVSNLGALLGGEIGVESEPGKGSRFWFRIPFAEANFDEDFLEGFMGDSIVEPLRVGIVEAQGKDEHKLENISKSLGWKVFSVASEAALIDEYSQRLKGRDRLPDVLLIDWQLPQLDALSLLEALFKVPEWKKIPVIAVTSDHRKVYIKKLDRKNMVKGLLLKPASTSELFSVVNDTFTQDAANTVRVLESTKMEAIKAKWLPDVRILVVDDSLMNLEVVDKILTSNGATVTTANSAEIAINHLRDKPDAFDVVLMDVHMPVMDGLEAVSYIRQSLNLKKLPIIALTAGTMDEEKNRALAAGMDDFLTKPIEPSRLIQSLRKWVENYREQAVMIEGVEVANNTARYDDWPVITGISNSGDLFQGDLKLFEFALKRLFDECGAIESLASDKISLDSREKRLSLAAQIHKLRGGAGMVGAKELYELSSRAEISLRKGENSEQHKMITDIANSLIELRKNCDAFLKGCEQVQLQKGNIDLSNVKAIDPDELDKLILALENNDLSAADMIDNNVTGLMVLLGESEFESLNNYTQNLNYRQAVELLKNKRI